MSDYTNWLETLGKTPTREELEETVAGFKEEGFLIGVRGDLETRLQRADEEKEDGVMVPWEDIGEGSLNDAGTRAVHRLADSLAQMRGWNVELTREGIEFTRQSN